MKGHSVLYDVYQSPTVIQWIFISTCTYLYICLSTDDSKSCSRMRSSRIQAVSPLMFLLFLLLNLTVFENRFARRFSAVYCTRSHLTSTFPQTFRNWSARPRYDYMTSFSRGPFGRAVPTV